VNLWPRYMLTGGASKQAASSATRGRARSRSPLAPAAQSRPRRRWPVLCALGRGATIGALGAVAHLGGVASAQVGAPPPASGASPCSDVSLDLRCPDLVMSAPSHLEMDRSTEPGRLLLRAASSINNVGAGPLELVGRRQGPGMRVSQAIYDQAGRRHVYKTAGRLVYKHVPGYRYGRAPVGDFSYWKFHAAATFELWSVNAAGQATALVRSGPKLDYCLRDLLRTRARPRSPRHAVYAACRQRVGLRRDVLGTSAGWSDVYPYEYPQQWIDVTGLRGRFAYVQIADPGHLLYETNAANNVAETYIDLPSGRAGARRVGLARP
jgi:hypothetical protein